MTLATADAAGRVSSRVLICKDVDDEGRWYFASDAASGKGRDLAANPRAAASFYWPAQGRQIRISGPAAPAGPEASAADFRARPPESRAAGLTGRQSQPLGSAAELDAAFRQAQAAVEADPDLVAPGWTLYALTARDGGVLAGRPAAAAHPAGVRARRRKAGDGSCSGPEVRRPPRWPSPPLKWDSGPVPALRLPIRGRFARYGGATVARLAAGPAPAGLRGSGCASTSSSSGASGPARTGSSTT